MIAPAHRLLDCRNDVRVGAAATDIAAHQLADLVLALRPPFGDEARGGTDLARRTIAALEGVMLDKGLLQRMQHPVCREPFDRRDFWPSFMTAKVRQELTRRPLTSTVQAPHWPWSQPFFVPVRSRWSRSVSSSVVHGASASTLSTPLTISRTGVFSDKGTVCLCGPVSFIRAIRISRCVQQAPSRVAGHGPIGISIRCRK